MSEESTTEATRRQFFRLLGRQTAAGAGNLIGTVNALRQTSSAAAGELLGLATDEADRRPAAPAGATATAAEFRSPYRLVDDALVILDQRRLPDRLETITCRDAGEVAAAMRAGAVGGGPVLGQLAAHAAALSVLRRQDRPASERRVALRTGSAMLRAARPTQQAIRHALARIEAADQRLPDDVGGAEHGRALLDEAEAIALAAARDHGRLAEAGVALLAARQPAAGTALSLLVHGDGGPLSGGLVGTSLAIVTALAASGRPIHVWLTEAGPTLEGARLGARQLAHNDVAHTVIADAAVSWLLGHRRLDAVLLRADWICANGDIAAPLGSLNVARLASAGVAGVDVYACAPLSVFDPSAADGSRVPPEFRSPSDGAIGPRLDPAADVVPAALLAGIICDAGLLAPPYAEALAAAAAGRVEAPA